MAPRRGGGGYSSSYYRDDNPWSETVWLSLDYYYRDGYKTFFLTQFAFDILSLLAFVAFLIWACTIRNRSLPMKGLICALTSFICSQINIVAWEALYVAEAEVTKYYLISLMLWDFFKFVAICLTFYVFWNLIHRFLGLIRASGKPHVAVTIIHYISLAIIFLVSLAEWGMSVASYVRSVTSTYDDDMQWIWTQLIAAEYIVYWVLSTEILAWGIFVAIKARSNSFVSKMPAMAFITAAISWCAVSSALAIIYIRYSLMPTYDGLPIYLNAAEGIIQFVLWVGTYTGILLCCAKWRNLGDEQKYPAPQFQPQYPPAQFQPQYLAQSPEGQYPPVQQQPYGVAPYLDHSAQPQSHPHHQPHHVSPQ
ncbi:hypothetical protein N7471_010262 [Penicillium samsonianum]|uniref:uncharacterized protein n=1 Tax=Penicillium samsonianum TaxID=1882272 RepID=UPI0025496E6C|nr:uncharacterized protein N7471_013073 [Penicillium samsonianum]XP_057133864.1 uncharacterized protein N7471_010262 [Penicillium samsonianum]KAJ6118453.1 hypothetical protein N7471_013073 [Penicillium samsonianum]KAJ6129045.1 hypothetical protein N7471_010262 [Penicillium samsonianum]